MCTLEASDGDSDLVLPFCPWTSLSTFINFSELQCAFLQSRPSYTYLQEYMRIYPYRYEDYIMIITASVRVDFQYILHTLLSSASFVTPEGAFICM